GLPQGLRPAPLARPEFSRSGPRHAPVRRQCQKPLAPRPDQAAANYGSKFMNASEDQNSGVSQAVAPSANGSRDSRLTAAVEEYRAALKDGRVPDRTEFLARYPEISAALAECLDALDFIHMASPSLLGPAQEEFPPSPADCGDIPHLGRLGDF